VRRIEVVTTSRADYGIYRPVLRRLAEQPGVDLQLLVSGSHLSASFGSTGRAIEADGLHIAERVDVLLASDTPESAAKAMGLGCIGFAQSFSRQRPDLLVVLGDRFEMHAAAVAALPFTIPVAHIHGGEVTVGAFDESLRHSLTKLSHLHFVATEAYARRVIQLGEEPWRVTVSGAPSLDNLTEMDVASVPELEAAVGMQLVEHSFLLVTFHPVSLEQGRTVAYADELITALDHVALPVLLTLPNADPTGLELRLRFQLAVAARGNWRAVDNLGTPAFFSAMSRAAAMVGNSSSGLIEAPSFGLPVVNIGSRQQGRVRGANVIDVPPAAVEIESGIRRALEPSFREALVGLENPYGDGHAAQRICERLVNEELGDRLLRKRFHDLVEVAP
jgi:UDP-hydrolysing UDP-N-acetyl-D-glucosamine 2-epimerase